VVLEYGEGSCVVCAYTGALKRATEAAETKSNFIMA
jgi:hypothetical protein